MAALVEEEYVRKTFRVHEDVTADRIVPYIYAASLRLKKWVGAGIYATPDEDLKELLKLAEATLVMHFMQLNFNTSIRREGLVKGERSEGNLEVQFYSPQETAQSAQMFLEQAENLLRGIVEVEDAGGIELIESAGHVDAGDTWGEWQTSKSI